MRVRFRYAKTGKIRWTSHRDVARMWERAFRRVALPLMYTQGFSPRPKVSFGLALPTGAESLAEYLDVELHPAVVGQLDAALPSRLTTALPVGLDVHAAALVDEGAGSLQEVVTSCSWVVDTAGVTHEDLRHRVEAALAADALVISRERKGKASDDDVRPGIRTCQVDGARISCELAAHPRALRPAELLVALGGDIEAVGMCRTHQWIECDGARRDPLPLTATDAPHAEQARAS